MKRTEGNLSGMAGKTAGKAALAGIMAAALLAPVSASAQLFSAPVTIEKDAAASDLLRVQFVDYAAGADESWYLTGNCEGAASGTHILPVQTADGRALRVHVSSKIIGADRTVCLTNPEAAPADAIHGTN